MSGSIIQAGAPAYLNRFKRKALLVSPFLDFAQFLQVNKIRFLTLTVAYVLLLSIIGMQNVPYWDDTDRRLTGHTNWGMWDGRWGSELVARLLFQGDAVVDLGLITFILSGVILALAASIVVYALAGKQAKWLTWVMALVFGLNPWFLNALAFRFDGPFFAISVLLAVATILSFGARPQVEFISYLALTWATANFFQPMLGLAISLLLTVVLLGWLRADISTKYAWQRVGIGFAGIVTGAVGYFLQTRIISPGRADVLFDFQNPFRAVFANTRLLVFQFVNDSSRVWLVLQLLVVVLFLVMVSQVTRRRLPQTAVALLLFFPMVVVASGNVLLLLYRQNLIGTPRFAAPLAMALVFLAIAGSTISSPTLLRALTRVVLVCFAYLWLSIVPIFTQLLREQSDSLRFQVGVVAAGLNNTYRTGDTIIYDPQVFHNPLYLDQVSQRWPIFRTGTYHNALDFAWGYTRSRFPEMLGLNHQTVLPFDEHGVCNLANLPGAAVTNGPRWQIFRADETTVCLAFPQGLVTTHSLPDGEQVIEFNALRFPFAPGQSAPGVFSGLELAVWSVNNPGDVQWLTPATMTDEGIARFLVSPPASGWYGNQLAAHLFSDGEIIYELIWTADE